MNANEVKKIIGKERIVPILRTDYTDKLMDIAQAVVDSGLKTLEFTMTIPGILDVVPKIKSKFPDLILGMGTMVFPEDAQMAIDKGIDFVVSHILNLDIVDVVKNNDKMLMLSGFTPTEIFNAKKAGSDIVKLFPATAVDPGYIKSLRGPMPDIDILPTGGLDLISGIRFLQEGAHAIGMGGCVFKKSLIKAGDFESITRSLLNVKNRTSNMMV